MSASMQAGPDNVNLRVPGEVRFLGMIRSVITMLARNAGFPDADVDQIELAVDEACSNVMEHGYRAADPKPDVELSIRWETERFVVDITDRGEPFDFSGRAVPRFPDHWLGGECRGAGMFLIRSCVDEAHYETRPGPSNRLRLVKHRRAVGSAAR